MDVNAVYIANTSPLILCKSQIAASNLLSVIRICKNLPFEVRLHCTGELLEPKVDFDIVFTRNKNYGVSNDIITQVIPDLNN
jgi:hypothetical protein